MNRDHRDYLRGLVRMDIRKKERALAKFAAKPGQPDAEVARVRSKFVADIRFRRLVLEDLTQPPERV